MLGKLFNLTSGSAGVASSQQGFAAYPKPSPESVQEEIHTRSLLFPDTQALYYRQDQVFPLSTAAALPSSSPNTFDYDGEIDLDVRDVRVIIMQDSLGLTNPSLLFDSHPVAVPHAADRDRPTQTTLVQDLRRNPTSPRRTSLGNSRPMVIQPESPQPRQGAFDRRLSFQARNYNHIETQDQRAAREYREELASFTSCIFSTTELMSYKGTSTKVHIIPSEPRAEVSSSYVGDGRGSMGRAGSRSSRLAQSFTSETLSSSSATGRHAERRKILVTRLFPVNLPNDDTETPNHGATPYNRLSEDLAGFPFPSSPDETPNIKKKRAQPKQKRTPMYAVALVLQLPPAPTTHTASKPVFRGSSSYTDQESFPSSFNSTRRSGWSMSGSGFGTDSFESTYSSEVEDRMDAITQHWDIIMRTLTHMQSVIATALFPMLKQADLSVPDPFSSIIPAQVARNPTMNNVKPPKTNSKLVTLPPECLMQDQQIEAEVDAARIRIVFGLRAMRVVTGQGRWGPWREEARWVARWAGGKEQGFFFFNLLTGFLATHTDWLQALSPIWYRRRYYQQQKSKGDEDTSLPSRTIIVSKDKMTARRLIFLLSAFLPANQQLPTVRTHRPTTSASFSHSPPTYIVPILREESLRRRMSRRPAGSRGASHSRSFSIQSQATTRSATGIPAQLAHLSIEHQSERRPSDATVFKHSNLPMMGNDVTARKSSAATTNTITPDAPIPHFTIAHRTDGRRTNRPGSSGSVAANDLKRTLTRVESSGTSTTAVNESRRRGPNWGNMISGLLGTRRRESTSTSTNPLDMGLSRDDSLVAPAKSTEASDKLSEMVKEAQVITTPKQDEFDAGDSSPKGTVSQPETPRTLERVKTQLEQEGSSGGTPDPSGAFESPVKTSINADDGVIDVDVQFPEYLTSLESAISSPSSSGYLSTPGLGINLDSFEQFSRVAIDGDAPLNVAGWLQQFHPDFALQAIPPQADLLEKVKKSLKAEPTPSVPAHSAPEDWSSERWVDISSAIVADTTNWTIKRLRYRRLVIPKQARDRNSGQFLSTSTYPYNSSLMTPALSPYEQPLKEKIDEEVLVTLDETLIEAVERVIAQSADISKDSSANSSRSVSKRRERSDSETSQPAQAAEAADEANLSSSRPEILEVPRSECRTVVLSALEGIAQDVVDQREREGQSPSSTKSPHSSLREKESTLRSAIRAWVHNVELGDG